MKIMKAKKISANEDYYKRAAKFERDQYYITNGIDFDRRVIELDSNVDEYEMGAMCRAIEIMANDDPTKEIRVVISTYGGGIYEGMALYDVMEKHRDIIHTIGRGRVMSMGLILLLAGSKRTATPRTTFMNHPGFSGAEGSVFDMETETKEFKRIEKVCIDIMAKQTGKTKKFWEKDWKSKKTVYYTTDRALELGILTE